MQLGKSENPTSYTANFLQLVFINRLTCSLPRKASFCSAGLSQKEPHTSSRQAEGAESRCRLKNKQGFTLVQAHDSAEIYRPARQAWP